MSNNNRDEAFGEIKRRFLLVQNMVTARPQAAENVKHRIDELSSHIKRIQKTLN